MASHRGGILRGLRPNVAQFYPLQSPPLADNFSNCRAQYRSAILPEKIGNHCVSSSMYVSKRKSIAVGKSSYKVGLPNSAAYSTKNVSNSSNLQRCRSGGCVAPKKKG